MPREKLYKVEAPGGKVHYASLSSDPDRLVPLYDPYCNHRTWLGDYWGKTWTETSKPVTCGNCLRAIGSVDLPLTEKLINLGNEIHQFKITQHKKFHELAKECPHRLIVMSDMFCEDDEDDDVEEHIFSCEHTKCKDSYEWWCHPMNCPHMALIHGFGELFKPNEKEIKDYEDSRRVKEDQTPRS